MSSLSHNTRACYAAEPEPVSHPCSPETDILVSELDLTQECHPSGAFVEPSLRVNQSSKSMPSNEQQYWKNPCIYRVPAFITNLNPNDYQPHVVSFGPYHHYDDHLRPMEEHKHRARLHFFQWSNASLEPILKSLRKVEHELKDSYNTLDPTWKVEDIGGNPFLELMITDGCFMLEIMRAAWIKDKKKDDYALDDPIFGTHRYITPYIRRDMLMLENQLPMLVLYQLVAASHGKEADECIECVNQLILWFYSFDTGIKGMGRCLHVLDVFRKCLLTDPESGEGDKSCLETCIPGMGHVVDVFRKGLRPEKDQQEIKNAEPRAVEDDEISLSTGIMGMGHVVDVSRKCLRKKTENVLHKRIRSATELDEVGIQFKMSKTSSLKDISFAGGKLKLPVIMVDDAFKSNFLNVMTFERLHIGAGTGVTSYIVFMDNIINNERDVTLLHAQGIIENSIGSNEAVAELFNSLGKEVTLGWNNSLESVQNDIIKHCNKRRNVWRAYLSHWRANLDRTYFRSPWAILSLVAAIILLVLTIIQTVYTVLSYY